jgi:glycosyltransferase involved in cell wall biosynthesis
MKVVFFQRKRSDFFFSIEDLFERIRGKLPSSTISVVKEMRFQSVGLFNRLYACVDSMFSQGDINHITGDIYFIAPFLVKRKTILTIHDLGFLYSHKGISRLILRWFWVQLPAHSVAAITTVSEATKKDLLKYVSISPDKVKVIYNPISPFFSKREKEFNSQNPVILQIGVTPNKNIPRLIEAIQSIPCRLYVLGGLTNEYRKKLEEFAIDFTEFKNLTVKGVVDLYASSDIVSFVSTVEGFGLPIVEANAVGRVVITSNISSMPEVAAGAAHLVDPFDVTSIREGILKVINDPPYRKRLIEKGYINTGRFNLSNIVNQYNGLYNDLFLK